ncbi:Crp/Fnr family transcriptional regulator [Streptomyces sp. 2RAF24]|uniref:Crp/Fnr family transcriptional regulator n=1 Tax=Streptomyces sp. 2RAF24 TaxID=3232997 RepID=UPI003F96FC14
MPSPSDPPDLPPHLPITLRTADAFKRPPQHENLTRDSHPSNHLRSVRPGKTRMIRYFQQQGVNGTAAAALADGSYLHMAKPGFLKNPRRGSGYIDVITSGVVSDGVRLWAGGTWIGDLDVFRDAPATVTHPQIETLCETTVLRIDRDVLRSWAMRDLSVQRMIYYVLNERLGVQEMVYGLDHRPTLARVAELIHYLARRLQAFRAAPPGAPRGEEDMVVQGPTQKDLADALGLSLASVEKSIGILRTHQVIASSGKGRANRSYTILDLDLLMAVGVGHPLA